MSPFVSGLLMIALGLVGTFYGYRIFRIILPIYGAIAGFLIAEAIFPGSAFLALIVGIVLAVILALLAYAFWSIFVTITGAALGASIGAAIAAGLNLWTIIGWILIIGLAVLAAIIVWKLRDEAIIILTAIAGAGYVAEGLQRVLGEGVIRNILFFLIFAVLAVVGIWWQWQRYRHLHVLGVGGPAAPQVASRAAVAPAAPAAAPVAAVAATAAVVAKSDEAAAPAAEAAVAAKAVTADISEPVEKVPAAPKVTLEERQAAVNAHLDELLSAEGERSNLAQKIDFLKDVTPEQAEKLTAAGLAVVADILRRGALKPGRAELARATGISESTILSWVNFADLMRIKGVAAVYSRLLEAAGVDTVVELGQRNPANLHAKIIEVNAAQKLSGRDPRAEEVAEWVAQAKSLPRIIEY